jgi:archaellin
VTTGRRIHAGARGLAGLEALIMMAALIIVAGFVAIALMDLSTTMNQKSLTQTSESRKDITAGFQVLNVLGTDASLTDPGGTPHRLENLYMSFRLLPGSPITPLNTTMITVDAPGYEQELGYNATCDEECPASSSSSYMVAYMSGNIAYANRGSLKVGDVVRASIRLATPLGEDAEVRINIIPVHGPKTEIKFTTPQNMIGKRQSLWPTT